MNWKKTLENYPEANFLQSPEWAKVNEILGTKVIVREFENFGRALMIVRNAKRGRYLEIACGPLIDWHNTNLLYEVFAEIRKTAKENKCAFVRIRPQLRRTPENLMLLKGLNLKPSPMHLAAEHTVILDLTKSEEELLADMRRQTRYEVRRADKLGIKVEVSNTEEIFREFHKVQTETAKRQHFFPPSLELLLAEHEAFEDKAVIYVAKYENQPVAYGLIIANGSEAEYYEAASTELNRKLPGAYALIWQAMKDLRFKGIKRFNLWGIAPPNQPHHRYAGVTTFKTGFGGEIVEYVPAHDLVINKIKYIPNLIVEKARKKKRHL